VFAGKFLDYLDEGLASASPWPKLATETGAVKGRSKNPVKTGCRKPLILRAAEGHSAGFHNHMIYGVRSLTDVIECCDGGKRLCRDRIFGRRVVRGRDELGCGFSGESGFGGGVRLDDSEIGCNFGVFV